MPRIKKPTSTPTLVDVAEIAGVSRATASRVVNGKASVAPALREAVEEAIAATGYVPNLAARALVTRSNGSIALAVSGRDSRPVFTGPLFGRIVSGITEAIRPRGMQLMLTTIDDEHSRRQLFAFLQQGRADGVALLPNPCYDPLPAALAEAKAPAVMFSRHGQPPPISFVELDRRAGVFLAIDHLVARGRRRISTVSGPLDTPEGREHLAAFRERLTHHRLTEAGHVEGDSTQAGGAAAMRALLAIAPETDAVFLASDLMALGAVGVLHRSGVEIPKRIAVVGFGDSLGALICDPPLTTVSQPVESMAALMAELLLRQIASAAPQRTLESRKFKPKLIVRDSA